MNGTLKAALNAINNKKGQQTVEFLFMLGTIVTVVLAFIVTFHKELAGGFFTVIGTILK